MHEFIDSRTCDSVAEKDETNFQCIYVVGLLNIIEASHKEVDMIFQNFN